MAVVNSHGDGYGGSDYDGGGGDGGGYGGGDCDGDRGNGGGGDWFIGKKCICKPDIW